jgi:hypothetical protein
MAGTIVAPVTCADRQVGLKDHLFGLSGDQRVTL